MFQKKGGFLKRKEGRKTERKKKGKEGKRERRERGIYRRHGLESDHIPYFGTSLVISRTGVP